MNFRFPTRFFALYLLGAFIISVSAAVDEPYNVGDWANFCQGAISHTFDDNTAQQTGQGQTAFDEKGFHMTLFTCTGTMSPNWTNLKNAFSKGHEIASHSVSHPQTMPVSELSSSQNTIKEKIPGEMCVTIAYPNCNSPGDAQVVKYYIAGRNCNGQLNPKSPSNWAQIGAKGFGSGQGGYPNDANSMNSFADQAASGNKWAVAMHHGIGSDNHSWATTNLNAVKGHLDYLDKNRNKIWCETFGNVARYIRERDAVKGSDGSVKQKDSTDKSFTVTVTDKLADSIFNYSLTIQRPLPDGWKAEEVKVTQGDKEINDTIVTVNSKQYIRFFAVPDGGDVVINGGIVGVNGRIPGFGTGSASPARLQRAALIIDPCRFNGSAMSVTIFDLTGKVLARYTLGSSESRIALPKGKFNRSAFIARITGGGNTWSGKFMPQM